MRITRKLVGDIPANRKVALVEDRIANCLAHMGSHGNTYATAWARLADGTLKSLCTKYLDRDAKASSADIIGSLPDNAECLMLKGNNGKTEYLQNFYGGALSECKARCAR